MSDSKPTPTRDEARPGASRGIVRSAYEVSTDGFRGPQSSLWEIDDPGDDSDEDVLK